MKDELLKLADELLALDAKATGIGWTVDSYGNICIGMKPLFRRTGASDHDPALILALRNNVQTIASALRAHAENCDA